MKWSTYLSEQVWTSRHFLSQLLWPLTFISRFWLWLNGKAYAAGWRRVSHLPVPVLVVGNVLVGGTGKTPVVISLVEYFHSMGWQVGVIARAYQTKEVSVIEVKADTSPQLSGDEPLLIKQRCGVPVFTGRMRAQAAQVLLERYPRTQLIISDDGLQHAGMHHDLAICVFDDRGLGNGRLLPAGPMRELWPRDAKGASQFNVHTGKLPFEYSYAATRTLSVFARNGLGEQRELASWRGHKVQALAAIARPELFFESLELIGLDLTLKHALPDHAALDAWQPVSHEPVFCTEKDAVKLWLHLPSAWAVPLDCTLPSKLLEQLESEVLRLSLLHGQKTT